MSGQVYTVMAWVKSPGRVVGLGALRTEVPAAAVREAIINRNKTGASQFFK